MLWGVKRTRGKANRLSRTGPTAQPVADSPLQFTPHKTRVVGDAAVAAVLAALDMAAESSRAALLNRRHDLELTQAHMPGIGSAPVGSMAMKDVCDLQPRAAHGRLATWRIAVSRR